MRAQAGLAIASLAVSSYSNHTKELTEANNLIKSSKFIKTMKALNIMKEVAKKAEEELENAYEVEERAIEELANVRESEGNVNLLIVHPRPVNSAITVNTQQIPSSSLKMPPQTGVVAS